MSGEAQRAAEDQDAATGSLFAPPDINRYLAELVEVGERHGFVLGHEDSNGAFLVIPRTPETAEYDEWLLQADKPSPTAPFCTEHHRFGCCRPGA